MSNVTVLKVVFTAHIRSMMRRFLCIAVYFGILPCGTYLMDNCGKGCNSSTTCLGPVL